MMKEKNEWKKINKQWLIIKLLKRITYFGSSIFDRQYFFNFLWIVKKLKNISQQKNSKGILLNSSQKKYIENLLKNDLILKQNIKKNTSQNLSFLNKRSTEWSKEESFGNFINLLKENDLDKNNKKNYFYLTEEKIKNTINKYINGKRTEKPIYKIKEEIEHFVSTRIDLGFSLFLINKYVEGEEHKLKKYEKIINSNCEKNNDEEDFLKQYEFLNIFFDKFKSTNVWKKENFSIFVPVSKNYNIDFKSLRQINNKDIGFKFVRYSYAEKLMTSPIHLYTKNFNKDNWYIAIHDKKSIDWHSLTNKVIWEKVSNIISIFKIYNISLNIDLNSPIITLKHIKNKTKIKEFKFRKSNLIEMESIFSIDNSLNLVEQVLKGEINNFYMNGSKGKGINSKFKSFLMAKEAYETSINPIERIHLSYRELELFLKFPHKKGYGSKYKTQFDAIYGEASDASRSLIKEHMNHLIFRNYSEFKKIFKWIPKDEIKNNSKKSHIINKIKKNLDGIEKMNVWIYDWFNHTIKEIQGVSKLPKQTIENFINFLSLSCIFVSQERHNQIHKKSRYDLKYILLSEVIDAFISSRIKQMSSKWTIYKKKL